ncbi:PQQ-binding-like beta-propeller repeat protein [Methanobrevibacter sp.]|uniref:Ig-like domain repeat protein n=1 Tax=Methanobrevibacter sp. TaxID=66852 RepID=UPI0026DF4A8E|nr:PQQ-binding-like beta-propeller repeat protein [Methanobrevibacter sp.]MDO5824097.1 PQQ-binding-like beta-propeller repeat protein [Methanobrevibacter sp.]
MNSKFFILILLLLLVGINCVSASEVDDANTAVSQEVSVNTQNELASVNLDDFQEDVDNQSPVLKSSNSQEYLKDGGSDVIVVNNWDELQYYCSLKDDDYTLKLKENTSFYPTDPDDSNYQIKVYNKVKIIGSEGSYIGYNSSNAPSIKYAAIVVPDNYKSGISMENVEFKWISVDYGPDGVFLRMGGKRTNTFKNCQFSYVKTSKGHSSILYLKKGTASLDNCSFINCTTDFGAVSIYDPNSVKTTDMVIRNCYFEGNYAKTEPGCINNCGKLTVYNTTFVKNRSFWWAGAIHTHSNGNTTIYDSNFTDNVAGWNGGALYTYSYLQIYNSVFRGNNCTTNSGGGAIGACAYLSKPHIYIENCLFEKNENLCWALDELSTEGTGAGGAIAFMDEGSIVVLNSTFIANSAAHGTAISANAAGEYGSPDVIIKNNIFINHTRVGDVLYVNLEGSSAIIEDNYFYGNSIEFSSLNLRKIKEGKNQATLQVTVSLTNPQYYDLDILNKTLFEVYVNGEYVKTVDSNIFDVDFDGFTMCDVYVIPTISNQKSNVETVASTGSYIYVSKSIGNDDNNGSLREFPVNTLKRAFELLNNNSNIVILDGVYDEENFQITHDLTIFGSSDVILINNTSFLVNANNFALKNINICNLTGEYFVKQSKGNLSISNCIFNNCNVSAIIDADNVNIVKSIFTNNNVVVYNNGFASIENSILLNNSKVIDNNVDNIDLNYNWWGNTLNNISKPTNLNINNWLYLNASSDVNVLELGKSSNIQFNCYLVEDNSISKYDYLVKFNLEISALNGTVNKNLVNYNSNVIYTQTDSGRGVLTARYNDISFDLYFDFAKVSPDLVIKASDIMCGQSLEVLILAPSDIAESSGTYKVSVGGKSLTKLTQYNSFKFDGLSAGDYEITVVFSGNKKYANKTLTSKVSVNKYATTTKITTDPIVVGDDLKITITTSQNTAGNITLTVNNITETLILDNAQATYTINNITRGDYYIKAVYNGNEQYAVSQDSILLEVDNLEPNISVSIDNSSYGEASIVNVTLNSDASGFVTATVGDITNSSKVENGHAMISIYGVDVGDNHKVSVFYTGDDNYYNKTTTANMNVSRGDLSFTMNSQDIYIGHDAVITINVPARTKGNFTIDGNVLVIPMSGEVTYTLKNLNIGNYTISAIFNGDNYNTVCNSTSFEVKEFDLPQWVSDGANSQNTQKSEDISICDGGVSWVAKLNSTVVSNIVIDSKGNIYVATADGIYSYDNEGNLRWIYASHGSMGNFTGLAIGRDVIISPRAGDTVYFVNQSNGEKYGYSNIYQASSLFAPIIDSNANIYSVSEYQYESSSYNLVITPYSLWKNGGDPVLVSLGNFKPAASPSVNDDMYVVIGVNSIMVIDAHNKRPIFIKSGDFKNVRPVIGEGNIIYAILDDSIIAYTKDGAHVWDTIITGGAGNKLLIDDEIGVYATNSKGNLFRYDIFTGEETLISDLNITSGILIDGNHNLYFASNEMFYGISPEGIVLWKSDLGSKITGTPVMNKDGIIYVTSEDNRLFALSDATLTDPDLEVSVSDIVEGEDALITIKINNRTTGNVSFTLNDIVYSFEISNGTILKTIPNLSAGTYIVNVTYPGDLRFNSTSKSATFTVKAIASLSTQVSGSAVTLRLPGDATGTLTIKVNGKTYSRTLANGKAAISLADGTYSAVVTYSGDSKYVGFTKTVKVTVKKPVKIVKKPSKITAQKKTFKAKAKTKKYTVTLKSGKTAIKKVKLTIKIKNKTYKATTNSKGKATFKINKLNKKGQYTATIKFAGNKSYKAASKKVKIVVK